MFSEANSLILAELPDSERFSFLVAFTGRGDGVSAPPFDTLNLSFSVGDDPQSVRTNRELLSSSVGLDEKSMFFCKQVHGRVALTVGERTDPGVISRTEGDALLSDTPDKALLITTADCLPVVVVDHERPALANIHAGRRGLEAGVVQTAVAALVKKFRSRPAGLLVFLGPCIRSCCYSVDEETAERFEKSFPLARQEKYLDLPGAAVQALLDAGIVGQNIHDTGLCTYCEPERFFSYRRSNTTGRQASIAAIRPLKRRLADFGIAG